MLLGAQHLANTRRFDGTVHFIFQPAEEGEAGARAMIKDGLLSDFPVTGSIRFSQLARSSGRNDFDSIRADHGGS